MSTATISAAALLASMATGKAKKSKSSQLPVNDSSLEPSVTQWIEANREVTKWESVRQTAEAQILAAGIPARLAACRAAGKVESTVRINDKLSMTAKAQYCKVDPAHADDLAQAFGEAAGRYFIPRMQIELTEAAAADETILTALLEALGPERFQRAFKVSQFLSVSEAFHADYTLRPDVEAAARPFIESEIIKPYKPSLRP